MSPYHSFSMYSPYREISLNSLPMSPPFLSPPPPPPNIPPSQPLAERILRAKTEPVKRSSRARKKPPNVGNVSRVRGGFGELLDDGAAEETKPVLCVNDPPQVKITDMSCVDSKSSSGGVFSTGTTEGRNEEDEMVHSKSASFQIQCNTESTVSANTSTKPLFIQSGHNNKPGISLMEPEILFRKSDNFQITRDDKKLLPHPQEIRGPALKRWTESIRLRLTPGRQQKRARGGDRQNVKVPPLTSCQPKMKNDEEWERLWGKVTSPGMDNFEGLRRRVGGSFVVVKIKDPSPLGFLSDKYVKKLEEHFCLNHIFGSVSIDEGIVETVRLAQV